MGTMSYVAFTANCLMEFVAPFAIKQFDIYYFVLGGDKV